MKNKGILVAAAGLTGLVVWAISRGKAKAEPIPPVVPPVVPPEGEQPYVPPEGRIPIPIVWE